MERIIDIHTHILYGIDAAAIRFKYGDKLADRVLYKNAEKLLICLIKY